MIEEFTKQGYALKWWCDCPPPVSTISGTHGSKYCTKCVFYVEVGAKYAAFWGCDNARPADRVVFTNVGQVQALPEQPEFQGFCTPCGGLRRHKRGCPKK